MVVRGQQVIHHHEGHTSNNDINIHTQKIPQEMTTKIHSKSSSLLRLAAKLPALSKSNFALTLCVPLHSSGESGKFKNVNIYETLFTNNTNIINHVNYR
jgi:hypothetical protein